VSHTVPWNGQSENWGKNTKIEEKCENGGKGRKCEKIRQFSSISSPLRKKFGHFHPFPLFSEKKNGGRGGNGGQIDSVCSRLNKEGSLAMCAGYGDSILYNTF